MMPDKASRPVYTAYNESRAIYLAHLTSISYCPAKVVQRWTCTQCKHVQPLQDMQVVDSPHEYFQGIVGYSPEENAVTVAFRGSMDLSNWIHNLVLLKSNPFLHFPDVFVHEGFYMVFESIAQVVVSEVHKLLGKYPTAYVSITGHSLGAAVAALCAFYFSTIEEIPVYELYTFGEPRVGNSIFTAMISEAIPNIYRLVHHNDLVPHIPHKVLGFHHTPQEIYYDEFSTKYTVCDDRDGEDSDCSHTCSPFRCTSIVDHKIYLNVTMSHYLC